MRFVIFTLKISINCVNLMKKSLFLTLPILLFSHVAQANTPTPAQLTSYALGLSLHQQLPKDVDINYLILALDDANNQSVRFSDAQLHSAWSQHQQQSKNAGKIISPQDNQQFLTDNAKKSGIKTTASGLQYQILKQGRGKSPKATSKVTVHYEGRLINGNVFDSSIQRGEPTTFPLNMVIKGWTEGLQLMQEGGKMRFFIPASLAYGDREMPNIPAHSTLIFDVELLKVQ